MRFFNKLLVFSIAIISLSSSSLFSAVKLDKVAVVNVEKIIIDVYSNNSASLNDIATEKEEIQANLDKIKEKINALEEAKLKEKDESKILAYQKKIDETKKKYSDYYKTQKYKLDQMVSNIQGDYIKEIYDAVKIICEKNAITLVLDSKSDIIFYYSIETDITDQVIDYLYKLHGIKLDDASDAH